MTSAESYEGSTTRELTSPAPNRPLTGLLILGLQLLLAAGSAALIWTGLPLMYTLIGFVLVLLLFLVTMPTLSWWSRHGKSRILTRKKLNAVDAGMWLVRPGSRYAVRVYDQPKGSHRNPTIADGLTREELGIIAPIYAFDQTPKGSRSS